MGNLENAIDMGGRFYTQAEIDSSLAAKANTATTLSGYGITDAYTKTEVDNKPTGFKNYIINGGFDVWQRGTDNTGDVGYLSADRWRIRGVNSAYSATVNMRTVREYAGANELLVQAATTDTGYAWIEQGIEFRKEDIGKTFTISFEIKDAESVLSQGSLNFAYRADFMSARDVMNVFIEDAVDVPTEYTKYSYTFTLPSFSNYVCIGIGLDGIGITSYATLFRIKNIQLEEGSVATPFEQRPYGLELSLCQRYYQRFDADGLYSFFGYGSFRNATQAIVVLPLTTSMRGTGNQFTLSSSGTFALEGLGTVNTVTGQANNTNDTVEFIATYSIGGRTAGQTYAFLAGGDSNAYLDVENEL